MSNRDDEQPMNPRMTGQIGDIQIPEGYRSGRITPTDEKSQNQYATESHSGLGRMRHGSPTFYQLLQEMAEIHDRKSHDYANNDNPSGNYHFAGKIAAMFAHSEQDAGFVGRLGEKLYRLANLESSQKIAQNESVEDTE